MEQIVHLQAQEFPNLSYRKAGTGQPVILLHGFPDDSNLWREVMPLLAADFMVIAPDLPGSGQSDFAGEELTMSLMAKSVKYVLDNEGINKALIVGHSMGGYTAMSLADEYPEYIKAVSLIHSLATADNEEKKETRRKAIELIRKGGKHTFMKQMVPGLFSELFRHSHSETIVQQVEKGTQLPDRSFIAFYNAMINRQDKTDILVEGRFPVQWIIGEEDKIASPDTVLKQAKLGNVNFVSIYPHCAHMSMLEHPGQLVKDIKEFAAYCYTIQREVIKT